MVISNQLHEENFCYGVPLAEKNEKSVPVSTAVATIVRRASFCLTTPRIARYVARHSRPSEPHPPLTGQWCRRLSCSHGTRGGGTGSAHTPHAGSDAAATSRSTSRRMCGPSSRLVTRSRAKSFTRTGANGRIAAPSHGRSSRGEINNPQ